MAPMSDRFEGGPERFDQSFLVQMIKDFFVILLAVTVLEFSLKAGLVAWSFWTGGERGAREVAEEVADNVREIMRNEGGPVAARTLYPILERNLGERGYDVAILPAPITVEAIEAGFGFRPEGIPAIWPEGTHREATVAVKAEPFCLSCHATAEVGDVLGVVTVRDYLSRDFAIWWAEVQLSAGFALGKIVVHSILLFLLLRSRLEPLIRLREAFGKLARAYGGLDHRVEIRSRDEFGMLARDVNLFLDRIGGILGELDSVLGRVVTVNDDILRAQGEMRGRVEGFMAATRQAERRAMLNARREPRLSAEWFDGMRRTVEALGPSVEGTAAARLVEEMRVVIAGAEAQLVTNEGVFEDLAALGTDSEAFRTAMAEMTRLEERMLAIVESGSLLVRRLRPPEAADAPGAAG